MAESQSARSQRRKERYNQLIQLGFSAKEARQYRDKSGLNIDAYVLSRQRQLREVEIDQLTPQQELQLERIERIRDRNILTFQQRTFSKSERALQFSTWSNRNIGFPAPHIAAIVEFNEAAGEPPDSPFGYKMFFYQYVDGLEWDEAEREIDERDS